MRTCIDQLFHVVSSTTCACIDCQVGGNFDRPCQLVIPLRLSLVLVTTLDRRLLPSRSYMCRLCVSLYPSMHAFPTATSVLNPLVAAVRPFSSTTKRACFVCRGFVWTGQTGNIPESFSALTALQELCVSLYPSIHAIST